MAASLTRNVSYVCRTCRTHVLPKSSRQKIVQPITKPTQNLNVFPEHSQTRAASTRAQQTTRRSTAPGPPLKPNKPESSSHAQAATDPSSSKVPASTSTLDPSLLLRDLRNELNAIATSDEIPDQTRVLAALEEAYKTANLIIFGQTISPEEAAVEEQEKNENISLLADLEEAVQEETTSAAHKQVSLPFRYREKAAADVCSLIYTLLKEPKVILDEDVLSIYVRIICQLGHPEYLPEIFFLYANKPIPQLNTKPVQYSDPSPNAAKNAIPQQLSDVALDTAILQRDLPLAIAIIDTTVATSAFRRNKFLRKGSIPLAAAGSTPLVAWAGAEWLAQWQDTFDPAMSKYMTMMGAMAYIGTLGTVGFIALTTWNDHHDRVVWTPGTPLRQRWTREEERLYFDRIAVAWGFQKRQRRGEEMGEEWEALREIVGERSMILDKSDLLEGMQ